MSGSDTGTDLRDSKAYSHTKTLGGSTTVTAADDENYDINAIVSKMLAKRDRKIPGSVFKPHSEEIVLLQSVALG